MKGYYDIVGDGGSQGPRAGRRAAHPHHRRARRGASSRRRGIRQGRRRQEHADAASCGRPSRPRTAGCDPGCRLQRPLTGAHGRRPGSAVRSPAATRSRCRATSNGIGVFSLGSLIPESESLEFESAAHGESHTWRATREFALLGEILASFEWGALDVLLFDLPPGAERTVQYADFLGPRTSFLLVTIPSEVSRGVVARSVAALSKGSQSRPRLRREHERLLLPRLQRHQAALRFDRAAWARAQDRRRGPGDPLPRDRAVRSGAGTAVRYGDCLSRNCPTHPSAGPSSMWRSSSWTASSRQAGKELPR